MRDGDPIRAIIRATVVNCDGRTRGMLTPNPVAQADLIRHAYEAAWIGDLSQTAIVECHGTGTPVGDPLELQAMANCFGEKGVIITYVKPNVGHSEGAVGLTSLIKCILALEQRSVLPNINFETPNPRIPFKKCNLHVPTEVEPWPKDRAETPERVSINSFGIGGVNAHVSNDRVRALNMNGHVHEEKPQTLLLFSAYSRTSLDAQIEGYREHVKARSREHKPHRSYAVTDDFSSLQTPAAQAMPELPHRIGWIFTGQGAQWPAMGARLIDGNATFRATINKLDDFLLTLPTPLPGTITAEAAMATASFRGTSSVSITQEGSMAAVGLGRQEVLPYLEPGVDIACENSQFSTTLSGDTEAVERVIEKLKIQQPGVFTRRLQVEKAYHPLSMLTEDIYHMLQYEAIDDPVIPLYSSVTGKRRSGKQCLDAPYWRANMESPFAHHKLE
ncbi:acyl transferase domain-containing protein [Xylaria intraflava]|nr:acyl transferase domain-containing protein [Xylaria intraflava]